MTSDDDFTAEIQRMADSSPKKSAKAAPKGMAASTAGPSDALFKPDEARQAEMPYSHEGLIAIAIDNPGWTTLRLAKFFGQTPGWLASVVASDEFQRILDPLRPQVKQTFLTATLEERFRGLTLRSMEVLQLRLDDPKVQDATVLKAAELGIKALGLGKEKEDDKPKVVNSLDKLAQLLEQTLDAKGGSMIAARKGMGGNAADADDEDEMTLPQDLKEVANG